MTRSCPSGEEEALKTTGNQQQGADLLIMHLKDILKSQSLKLEDSWTVCHDLPKACIL